ncbi:LCP family protein [Sinobaca qinghaiensis]|nr:LCP family protein [Sinobaca qinghaiensis]
MSRPMIIFGSIFIALLLAGGGYALYLYDQLSQTADDIHEPIARESELREPSNTEENSSSGDNAESTSTEEDEENPQPLSFLIMGVDDEESTSGRSDTMILLTVNPGKESIKMVSIPRDTLTEISGRGTEDKINHAYAFGGAEMAMDSVEGLLDVPVDHFATVNMQSFEDIVDTLGGVTVQNNLSFEDNGHSYPEGEISLDGEEALSFVRMRYEDPQGDLGRTERQRQVLDAVIQEGASISSITRIQDYLTIVEDNVRTSLTFADMRELQSDYRSARHNIDTLQLEGEGIMQDDIYYLELNEQRKNEVSDQLKEHLEI